MTKIIKFQLIQRSMATSYTLLWIFLILNLLFRSCHCSTQQQPQQEQPSSKLGVHMVRSPESTVAPLRDEVLFECELNLEPERLDWRFRSLSSKGTKDDFIYLNKNDGYNITTFDGTSKLRVYVSQNTVGEYQCVAWFGASALASIPAKLTLAAISTNNSSNTEISKNNSNGQLLRRISPSHSRVHPGNSVLIKCGEVTSNPLPVWSFYKNNNAVPSSVPQLSTGTLVLQSVSAVDSATYSCAAVNSITGTEIKLVHRVTIDVTDTQKMSPTFFSTPNSHYNVKQGATAILECPGIGNPVPEARWSRPDAPAIYTNRTTVLSYGLQILNVIPEDRGTYVCRLDNGIAPALVHTIKLDVQEVPVIMSGPQETLTNESESLELECVARGYPMPDIYWMINGADTRWDSLIRHNGTKIIIKSVEKKHAGIVQCFARNDVGEKTQSSLLQVKPKQIPGVSTGSAQPPLGTVPQPTKGTFNHARNSSKGRNKHKHIMIPPSRPSVTRLADEKVMVRWSVPDKEGLPIQFFKVQFRELGDTTKKVPRSQWMTSNEDIPPQVKMYEVENLKPDHYYRFRIAAVYSNNDNKLSNVSAKFLLQRGSQLGPNKSHLIAPNLTRVEPISETAVVLHWLFPTKPTSPVDGFYAYYRPASTAGEYSKATVDGMHTRRFKIDNLEPGTAYEFKLQSFTSSAASDFIAIITGKTLKPSIPPPSQPDPAENETLTSKPKSYLPLIAGAAGGGSLLLLAIIFLCVCFKRKRSSDRDDDANENKTHPNHIQAETNGFAGGNGRVLSSPTIHSKNSRLNGVVPRMNITSNPLAQDTGDKNRNVMELRFLPSSLAPTVTSMQQHSHHPQQQQQQQQQISHHHHPHHQSTPPLPHPQLQHKPPPQNNNFQPTQTPPPIINNDPHRRTLERSTRNIHYAGIGLPGIGGNGGDMKMLNSSDGFINGIDVSANRVSSVRRTRRTSGSASGPGSPRVVRGVSSELLHNRSPMPSRAITGKRNRLGSRTENMSSGSLNSIEV